MTERGCRYGVGAVAGSFFFCFLPSSRVGGCSFNFGATSAGRSCFGFSTALSAFVESGPDLLGLFSGGVAGGATRGAAGGGTTVSYLCLSPFSFDDLGATVGGAAASAGGTEALGFALSRCLFLPLSRVGAGLVAAGTDADGVAIGAIFSFRLFLFFSGVVAAVIGGLTEADAFGAGDLFSFRLFFSWAVEIDGLVAGALGLAGAFSEA